MPVFTLPVWTLQLAALAVSTFGNQLPELHASVNSDLDEFRRAERLLPWFDPTEPIVPADRRGRFARSLQCLQPMEPHLARQQFGAALANLTLRPGRLQGDLLPESCGVDAVDGVVTSSEAEALISHATGVLDKIPPEQNKGANRDRVDLTRSIVYGSSYHHLLYLKTLEKVRRLMARSLGIALQRVQLANNFISRVTSSSNQHYHCDESSFGNYHFSAVLYLNTFDKDFTGGTLEFTRNDLAPLVVEPLSGRLVYFSSGWENKHQVREVKSGDRWSMPVFFTVTPSAADRYKQAIHDHCIAPKTNEAFAKCAPLWSQYFDYDEHTHPHPDPSTCSSGN